MNWESRRGEIERLYIKREFSQAELAAFYNVSQPTILKAMRRLGIPARHRPRKPETGLRAHFVGLATGVFAKPGWWTPKPPSVAGVRRMVRGMGA